jgi:hypothetical protein
MNIDTKSHRLRVIAGCVLVAGFFGQSVAQPSYSGVSKESPTGSTQIAIDGLVAAYDFETYTDAGQLMDFSSFGNHGVVGKIQEVAGLFGTARVFRDLEDVVDLPEGTSLDLGGPLSIAAWLQLSTSGLHQHILSCDDIFVLWTTEDNQYRLADTQGGGLTTAANTTPIGNWHSVVAVMDAGRDAALTQENIRIYIDGVEVSGIRSDRWSPATLRPVDGCYIGMSSALPESHQQLHFDGIVDEMLVFSRSLSPEEISAFSTR